MTPFEKLVLRSLAILIRSLIQRNEIRAQSVELLDEAKTLAVELDIAAEFARKR